MLVQAGAMLSGADVALGFTSLAVRRAKALGDEDALRIWDLAGANEVT